MHFQLERRKTLCTTVLLCFLVAPFGAQEGIDSPAVCDAAEGMDDWSCVSFLQSALEVSRRGGREDHGATAPQALPVHPGDVHLPHTVPIGAPTGLLHVAALLAGSSSRQLPSTSGLDAVEYQMSSGKVDRSTTANQTAGSTPNRSREVLLASSSQQQFRSESASGVGEVRAASRQVQLPGLDDVEASAEDAMTGTAKQVSDVGEEAASNISDAAEATEEALNETTKQVNDAGEQAATGVSDIAGAAEEAVTDTAEQVNDAGKQAAENITGVAEAAEDAVAETAKQGYEAGEQAAKGVADVADAAEEAAADVAKGAAATAGAVAGATAEAASTVNDVINETNYAIDAAQEFIHPNTGQHSLAYVNKAFLPIVALSISAVVAGYAIDLCVFKGAHSPGHPRPWVRAILLVSYAVLVPGLFCTLMFFNMSIEVAGFERSIAQMGDKKGPVAETTFSLIQAMWTSGGLMGAALLFAFAIVVPAVKAVLLVCGEACRWSRQKSKRTFARYCILGVQVISKWACPDMFAYIMLSYLFRQLEGVVDGIHSTAQLDVGFTCFSVFCVLSTISSSAINLPIDSKVVEADRGMTQLFDRNDDARTPLLLSILGTRGLVVVAVLLAYVYFTFLLKGISQPVMGMQLLSTSMVQPQGNLPRWTKPMVDLTVNQVNAEVNFLSNCNTMLRWFLVDGELNCGLAFFMLAGFAMLLPALTVVALVVATVQLHSGHFGAVRSSVYEPPDGDGPAAEEQAQGLPMHQKPSNAFFAAVYHPDISFVVARILGHLEMLDVCVVGVFVTAYSCKSYEEQGLRVFLLDGLWCLLAAEAVHYLLYYLVEAAVHHELTMNDRDRLTSFG